MKRMCLVAAILAFASPMPLLAQSNLIPSPNLTAPPPDRTFPEAPVGHRQPRASATPLQGQPNAIAETPQEAAAREDAALDRKIKGICRGC